MKRTLAAVILLLSITSSPISYGATQDVYCKPASAPAHVPAAIPQPTGPLYSFPSAMTLVTNCGEITIELASKYAPLTVTSLMALAAGSYYDNSACHRVTTEGLYVIQCGDPTGTGRGHPALWEGYQDENLPKAGKDNYPIGTVAMANAGPGTNGGQIFFVFKNTTLNPSYTIWGNVISGMSILNYVASKGVAPGLGTTDGPLSQALVIEKVILRDSAWFAAYSDGRNESIRLYEEQLALASPVLEENLRLRDQIQGYVSASNNQLAQIKDLQAQITELRAQVAVLSGMTLSRSITCVKGSVTKRVTGVNPKCPSGYKSK